MKATERSNGNLLVHLFAERKPVIPFLTAGFPTRSVFMEAALAAVDAGAGAIEIGMPFSDPLADGPVIQHTSQKALNAGVDLPEVLRLTERVRQMTDIPIFLMGYLNPLVQMGLDRFAAAAVSAGATGTIIPDCPVGEAGPWRAASRRQGLANVFLMAPTTPDERIAVIDRSSSAFSYCVSVAGVTGARGSVASTTIAFLRRVKKIARKPYVVGFGISQPAHIAALRPYASGFVVGSALVKILDQNRGARTRSKVGSYIKSLVRAAER